ncbi:hypothetical protein [Thiobacillus sp. 65-1402]|uniref:hypothetical protein n=1 Tax=Thiobacillus sp. 65-1402 TaxID=1895861 RepID=UPI0025D8BBE0|nr:hypothetical protein [Thiobacillus sp. 65-1402]
MPEQERKAAGVPGAFTGAAAAFPADLGEFSSRKKTRLGGSFFAVVFVLTAHYVHIIGS